jgi:iron complex transport system substrate-binding protein
LKKTNLSIAFLLAVILCFCACNNGNREPQPTETLLTTKTETQTTTTAKATETEIELTKPSVDMDGNQIDVPEEIDKIMTLAPSITQITQSMGYSEMIVGIDDYSGTYLLEPLDDVPVFDMQTPDSETILTLEPDIIFVTGMNIKDGINPYQTLIDSGICIAVIPSADSLDGIKRDIQFIADCMGEPEKATAIIDKMNSDIETIKAIGDTITDKKRIHFEISALPYIYSFGKGTFLDEMITLIGAENVYADEESWIAVTEEAAIAANPDVILTVVNYIDDPEGEIKSRAGWEAVTAVKNGAVHKFTSDQTDVPNQFVTEALFEMAKNVYPDEYAGTEYKK